MSDYQMGDTEAELASILKTDSDPLSKVRQIMRLGFEEEVADDMVERYLLGQPAPVYYEQLTRQDYIRPKKRLSE